MFMSRNTANDFRPAEVDDTSELSASEPPEDLSE